MSEVMSLRGFINNVKYKTFLKDSSLPSYKLSGFDANEAEGSGLIELPYGQLAFSKWVSPKRTRTYPFARLYDAFNYPSRITIIPVIKDEGLDGDLDRIQYSTFSWMNLMGVHVVLTYYESAKPNKNRSQAGKQKIAAQKLNNELVKEQIEQISQHKKGAIHWNRDLFANRFVEIYGRALDSYEKISQQLGIAVHQRQRQEDYIQKVTEEFAAFKNISLKGSKGASIRESRTAHELEYLTDGSKVTLEIANYLGGLYFLTADECVIEDDVYVLQESKNTTKKALPSSADIKDGLFKLILYSNLDKLILNDREIKFSTRLKLTGAGIRAPIRFPCANRVLEDYLDLNVGVFKQNEKLILRLLNRDC